MNCPVCGKRMYTFTRKAYRRANEAKVIHRCADEGKVWHLITASSGGEGGNKKGYQGTRHRGRWIKKRRLRLSG